jgi:hypothetical protein
VDRLGRLEGPGQPRYLTQYARVPRLLTGQRDDHHLIAAEAVDTLAVALPRRIAAIEHAVGRGLDPQRGDAESRDARDHEPQHEHPAAMTQ